MAAIPFSGVQGDTAPGTISVPNDYQTTQANPAAFGAGIGTAEQGFGQAAEKLGTGLQDFAIQQRQFERRVTVTDALNQVQDGQRRLMYGDPSNPSDVGFYGSKGKAALSAYSDAVQAVNDQRQQVRDGLTDPIAAQMFDRESRRLTSDVLTRMAVHRQQQLQVYGQQTAQAGAALSQQDAVTNYRDDAAFTNHLADAQRLQAQADQLAGAPPEEVAFNQRKVASDAWAMRVNRLAADDPIAAQNMLESNLGQLLPQTQTQLIDHLKPQVQKAKIDALTGQVTGQGAPSAGGGDLTEAVHQLESGGSMAAGQTGDGGFAHGPMQVHAPALADVNAKLGTSYTTQQLENDPVLGKKVGATYLQMMRDRYGRDDYALGAYNQGPGAMDDAIASGKGVAGLPGGGPQYVARGLRLLGSGSGGGAGPSPSPSGAYALPSAEDVLARADRATAGESLEVQDGVRAKALGWLHQQQGALHGQQTALHKQLQDTTAALQDGRDVSPVNEASIRTAFPPEQAEPLIEQQRVAQTTGYVTQAMRFASPADRQQMLSDAMNGTGQVGKMILGRGAGALPIADDGSTDDTADYRLRRQAADIVVQRSKALDQQLASDPALYVSQSPAVQPFLAAAAKPGATADDRAAAVHALLAEQERMGVPAEKRMAVPMSQAAADVHTLQTVDPSKADMGQALQQKAATYGAAWPDVFGSYVKAGLSPEYQALALMDRPEQVADRADFQRALSVQAEKGGVKALREAVPHDAAQGIDQQIDQTMQPLRASMMFDQNMARMYDNFRDSVKTLAYYKAMRGDANALDNAYQGIIGKRYDFDGSMRVPKGQLGDVRAATDAAMDRLQPSMLPALADSTPGLTDDDKRAQLYASIRSRGQWVPSADDGGLQLVVTANDGTPVRVTAGGNPVEVRFDQLSRWLDKANTDAAPQSGPSAMPPPADL